MTKIRRKCLWSPVRTKNTFDLKGGRIENTTMEERRLRMYNQ